MLLHMVLVHDFEKPTRIIAPQREAKSNDTGSILPTIMGGKTHHLENNPCKAIFISINLKLLKKQQHHSCSTKNMVRIPTSSGWFFVQILGFQT